MKKLIAILLSVLLLMGSLGVAASAASIVGCDPPPQRPGRPNPPAPPCTEAPTEAPTAAPVTIIYVVENESDPTTVVGFLYRVIKTLVPYIYKLLSMLSVNISFNGDCTCGCNSCCNGNHCGNCGGGSGSGGAVLPPIIVVPGTGTGGGVEVPTTNGGDTGSGSDGLLSQLLKDLFSGSGSES